MVPGQVLSYLFKGQSMAEIVLHPRILMSNLPDPLGNTSVQLYMYIYLVGLQPSLRIGLLSECVDTGFSKFLVSQITS